MPELVPERVPDLSGLSDPVTLPSVVVATVGGCGGAGASTLAAALAMTGVREGLRTMLVDGDPLGGGIDLLLGAEDEPGLRWGELADLRGAVSGAALTATLPSAHGVTVLSHDRTPAQPSVTAVAAVLDSAASCHDLVVVDLARSCREVAEVVARASRTVLLVVPAQVRAVAAAGQVAAWLCAHGARLRLVVRGPSPSGLGEGTVSDLLGLPSVGWLEAEPRLGSALERGQPPARSGRGPLVELGLRVVRDALADREPAA